MHHNQGTHDFRATQAHDGSGFRTGPPLPSPPAPGAAARGVGPALAGLLVSTVLGEWADWAAEPEVLFRGGPVGTDAAVALASVRSTKQTPDGFQRVVGSMGLLDLDTPVEEIADTLVQVRLFAGYAGWDADQLRGALARGDWDVVPGQPGDVFWSDTSDLWRTVLRRQPGEMAWRATRPADPELN